MTSIAPPTCVADVIARHRGRSTSEEHTHMGYRLRVHPDVFSPFIAPSGRLSFALAGLPLFNNKDVLDVGSGAGIFGVFAALSGARRVIGIDVNPSAVENATDNARSVRVARRTTFIGGNLFDPLDANDCFDVIFADLPFTNGDPADMLDRAFYDKDLLSIRHFVAGVRSHMRNRASEAYVCLSDIDDPGLGPLARDAGLNVDRMMDVRPLPWIRLMIYCLTRAC